MVSDAKLVERLRDVLRVSDLETTTTATVRRKLEEEFGVDLSDKKAFIREQVDIFLQSEFDFDKKEEVEGHRDEEGEEEENGEEESGEGGSDSEQQEDGSDDEEKSNSGCSSKRSDKDKEVKRRGGGFTKLCGLSPQLGNFVGVPELARTEVVKKLWAYIRENNLQDPSNKRKIICDEALRSLFNVNTIDMFQMNKALSRHIWPLNSDEGSVSSVTKEKQNKRKKEEGVDKSSTKVKKRKGGATSGFLVPLPLSDALVGFFGTGENALPRAQVVKKIWGYIKENNLQDPADKRNILCDGKLKELFNVESFNGFTVSKLLAPHFIKAQRS